MTAKNSRKELTFVLIALFVCTSITPALAVLNQKKQSHLIAVDTITQNVPDDVVVTCYMFGYPGKPHRQITMSRAEAETFYSNFYGTIDEVRVSDIGRPSAWITTEYNTMNDPAQFLVIGPEEPGP